MECCVKRCYVSSPIGNMLICCCVNGLHIVQQVEFTSDDVFNPDLNTTVELLGDVEDFNVVKDTVEWFKAYFRKTNDKISDLTKIPAICNKVYKPSFRFNVWLCLAKHVRFGETISYGSLAKLLSKPGAARAVGSAMSNNPIQIIVPCHRVIKSDGCIGSYAKGCRDNVKKWLLHFEGAIR